MFVHARVVWFWPCVVVFSQTTLLRRGWMQVAIVRLTLRWLEFVCGCELVFCQTYPWATRMTGCAKGYIICSILTSIVVCLAGSVYSLQSMCGRGKIVGDGRSTLNCIFHMYQINGCAYQLKAFIILTMFLVDWLQYYWYIIYVYYNILNSIILIINERLCHYQMNRCEWYICWSRVNINDCGIFLINDIAE